jgi:hypothetical protein
MLPYKEYAAGYWCFHFKMGDELVFAIFTEKNSSLGCGRI